MPSLPSKRASSVDVDGDRGAEIDAALDELSCRTGEDDAAQHVALAHRVDLGSTSGDHHLVCVHVEHVLRSTHHDERSWIDTDDVVAVSGVEYEHFAACGTQPLGFGSARVAGTDHGDIDVTATYLHVDVHRRLHGVLRRVEL